MNILYIIGNGSDLNLGLKTSYRDFYEYYSSVPTDKDSVSKLKTSISANYKNWSDLELAFGQYTEEIKDLDEFDEIFEDIGEHLAKYLKNEESKFDVNQVDKHKFFENLINPELFLPVADKNKLATYKTKFKSEKWFVDIVTFNYTTIIEKIIGSIKNEKIGNHVNPSLPVIMNGIEHLHGYLDNRMILGVNDVSQLKNKEFHENIDILEAIIKEQCNKSYGHTIDELFKSRIANAHLICIFGASMGDTDNMWWELVGERLINSQTPLIIFTKGEEVISPRIGYKNNRTKRKMRDYFLKKTNLEKEDISKIRDRIYLAMDTQMFKKLIND